MTVFVVICFIDKLTIELLYIYVYENSRLFFVLIVYIVQCICI
jgi:hypothetical protein